MHYERFPSLGSVASMGTIPEQTREKFLRQVITVYRPQVYCETAIENTKKWLDSDNVPYPDTGTQSVINGCTIQFIPFWKVHANVSGYIDGYRIEPDGSEYPDRIPMYEKLEISCTWNGVASKIKGIGVRHIYAPDQLVSPTEICEWPAERVTISRESAKALATTAIREKILNHSAIPEITRKSITIEADRTTLFAYPFHVVTYSYRGREYSVIIDGLNGDVACAKAPGDLYLRVRAFLKGTGILMGWITLGLAGSAFIITRLPGNIDPLFIIIGISIPWYLVPLWLMWKSWQIICREYALCRFGPRFPDMKYHEGKCSLPEPLKKRGDANLAGIILGYTILLTGSAPLALFGMWPVQTYTDMMLC